MLENPIVIQMITVALGMVVSFAVTALKKVPFVAEYPKIVAAVIGAVVSVILSVTGVMPAGILGVVVTSISALGLAVGNYEVVTKPIEKVIDAPVDTPLSGPR